MTPPDFFTAFAQGLFMSASLIIAIGAQNTFVLRQGLRREHVPLVVALCAVMDALLIAAGVSGVAAALGRHQGALDVLALGGAVFLLVYGVGALRRALAPPVLLAGAQGAAQPARAVLGQALAITLLNPHVYLDTVLLLGAAGAQYRSGLQPAFVLGGCVASAVWFTALGFGARLLAPVFARPQSWRVLEALVAATMFALAGMLASAPLMRLF
jgi:L-lysine exporter family protein LysE/ArgO